jgi:hypothetical protein
VIDEDTGVRAYAKRERAIEQVVAIFRGRGSVGDTTGNCPGSKWVPFNAIAEHLTTDAATRPGATRCSACSRTPRSSNERSSS